MIRLVAAEAVAGLRTWAGLLLVAAVAAVAIGLPASALETGAAVADEVLAESLSSIAAVMFVFGGLAAVAVTASVSRLAVRLARADYARWQLAGATPGRVTAVVLVQLLVAGLLGGCAGLLAVRGLMSPSWHLLLGEDLDGVAVLAGAPTAIASIAGAAALVLLGGGAAAIAAGRVSPLAALGGSEAEPRGAGAIRWAFAVLVPAGAAWFVHSILAARLRGGEPDPEGRLQLIFNIGPLLAPVLATAVVAMAPLLYPLLLRAWTGIVPARWSGSWMLARHQARYHLRRSTAAVTPLFVGAAMYGGLFTSVQTMGNALDGDANLAPNEVLVLLGGPVALGVVGAAVVIFMSNRSSGREQALLDAAGAGRGMIVRIAALQASMHVATAALLAGGVILATGWILAEGMRPLVPGGVAPSFELLQPALLVGLGLVLTLAATVLPVLGRLREPLARRLAGE
ncbi:FtsX-like permease family protein [Gulosibacter sp. 10]|uniref:FtsX-like permease family protein n=1 Tax=Gulosibacter sp. 10 TaxID=1255570 RepID=UPI00097EB238|nr:FtsX-like permease family protein [Gulosibacter sp. 10]SJM66215.1 ABC transporter, permease protein [Gulosibacter sp. 10]